MIRLLLLLALVASPLWAQPRCKKGCACGNACISCAKTCRIGSGSARSVQPPPEPPRPAPARVVAPTLGNLTSDTTWIGSATNRLYFLSTCPIACLLPEEDRLPMRDTVALARLGFKRLVVPGC